MYRTFIVFASRLERCGTRKFELGDASRNNERDRELATTASEAVRPSLWCQAP